MMSCRSCAVCWSQRAVHPRANRGSRGRVVFPNSGSAAAQADFLRGVAWLHSFGYEDAIDAFRAAQKIDPSFALAYWGEAMSFSQPLWFYEEVATRPRRAGEAGADTRSTYRQGEDAARAGLHARRRSALRRRRHRRARRRARRRSCRKSPLDHPADDEAQTFYALALLATLPRGDACAADSAAGRRDRGEGVRAQSKSSRRRALHPARLRSRDAGGAKRCRQRGPTRRSRRRRATRSTCPRMPFCRPASGMKQPRATKRRGTRRSRGRSGAASDCEPRLSQPRRGCSTEWTQQGRFSKTKEAIAFVDQALKASGPPSLQAVKARSRRCTPAAMATARRVKSAEGAARPRCVTIVARCARATSSRASAGRR